MMKNNRFLFVAGMGLWTAVTLGGSIYLVFNNPFFEALTDPLNPHRSLLLMLSLFGLNLFVIGATGGGVWGAGLAYLLQHKLNPLVKTGALFWCSTINCAGITLYLSQILGAAFNRTTHFSIHDIQYLFTSAFALAVGIAAMVNTRNMTGKLGIDDLKQEVGCTSGLAAGGAFLVTSLVLLFGFG